MARILRILFILWSFNSYSSVLKTGDILLQPLSCWSCSLIEQQENSQFSHIGVFIKINKKSFILEALGEVRLVALSTFLARTKKNKKVLVRRNLFLRPMNFEQLISGASRMVGKPYDKEFRWDNFYQSQEAFYCSELVFKLFDSVNLLKRTEPKRMPFDINPIQWDRYFNGHTPRGEIGVSPEDFHKSLDFFTVFEI